MLPRLALAALLCVAACKVDPSDDDVGEDATADLTRAERCDTMRVCGEQMCGDEVGAAFDCFTDDCPEAEQELAWVAQTSCLENSGCNVTSCPISADGLSFDCMGDEMEQRLISVSLSAMVRINGAETCATLE